MKSKKLAAEAVSELERKSARRQALSDILQFAAGIVAFIYSLFAPPSIRMPNRKTRLHSKPIRTDGRK
jgi:hypothetical protein